MTKRWANIVALDCEGTGRHPGGKILSVGFAVVSRYGVQTVLFSMPGIHLPVDVYGTPLMTQEGGYVADHARIHSYGDFDKSTWDWWTSSPEMALTLWSQIDWDNVNIPQHVGARLRGQKWNDIRRWLDKVSLETEKAGGKVRLCSDNAEYDFGFTNAEMNMYCTRAYFEKYPLNFLPINNVKRRHYNNVTAVDAYMHQRKAKIIAFEDHSSQESENMKTCPHNAASDALTVALVYAGYLKHFPQSDKICEF